MLDLDVLVLTAVGRLAARRIFLVLRGRRGLVRRAIRGLASRRRTRGRGGRRVLSEGGGRERKGAGNDQCGNFHGASPNCNLFSFPLTGKISRESPAGSQRS